MSKPRNGAIITLGNNKGGTGKTSICCTVAASLALKGHKVLVIDADAQANTTANLYGQSKPDASLYDIFRHRDEKDIEVTMEELVQPTSYDNLSIIPTVQALALCESRHFQTVPHSYKRMKNVMQTFCRENFDFTFVDTSPALGYWLINALMMSTGCIIPVEAGSQFAIDGLFNLVAFVQKVAEKNTDLDEIKIAINMADGRTSASKSCVQFLQDRFSDFCFKTIIPRSTAVEQAQIYRETVLRHAGTTPAAKRFRALAEEIKREMSRK